MTLDEASAMLDRPERERRVTYLPQGRSRGEHGVITGVGDRFVFVRYARQQTAAATRPEDLTAAP